MAREVADRQFAKTALDDGKDIDLSREAAETPRKMAFFGAKDVDCGPAVVSLWRTSAVPVQKPRCAVFSRVALTERGVCYFA